MTLKATLTAAFPEARRISNFLERDYGEDGVVVSLDERADGLWSVDAYFEAGERGRDRGEDSRRARRPTPLVRRSPSMSLPETDWVASGLKTLTPVVAGRFLVHGSHDRERCRAGRIAIEIDAGQAFGTGHHASTAGVPHDARPADRASGASERVLDLGTGSGVLAIALAKALQRPVLATDIDPVAVRVAAENAARNNVRHLVRTDGRRPVSPHPAIRRAAPYDLVVANILAEPLRRLAPQLAPLVARGGIARALGHPVASARTRRRRLLRARDAAR